MKKKIFLIAILLVALSFAKTKAQTVGSCTGGTGYNYDYCHIQPDPYYGYCTYTSIESFYYIASGANFDWELHVGLGYNGFTSIYDGYTSLNSSVNSFSQTYYGGPTPPS